MKIGELARTVGVTPITIRYYESMGLLPRPGRTSSNYRVYGAEHVERLQFIRKAKRLGLSLEEIKGILYLHDRQEAPCVHVLALLDQKVEQVNGILKELRIFRRELVRLKEEYQARLDQLPEDARICSIIERGIHTKGQVALAWLEGRDKAKGLRATAKVGSRGTPLDSALDWKV